MALNPALLPMGPGAPLPTPYAGEFICAARDGVRFEVTGLGDPNGPSGSRLAFGSGCAYLTNYRLVFVADAPTAAASAVELPLLFIEGERVAQPIFACNNLAGDCRPVGAPANTTTRARWRLDFKNGGFGTFVPLYYAAVAYIRTASRHAGAAADAADAGAGVPATSAPPAAAPPSFLETALVDPGDPTRIFFVADQPEAGGAGGGAPPAWQR
jgi:hypothetical protein